MTGGACASGTLRTPLCSVQLEAGVGYASKTWAGGPGQGTSWPVSADCMKPQAVPGLGGHPLAAGRAPGDTQLPLTTSASLAMPPLLVSCNATPAREALKRVETPPLPTLDCPLSPWQRGAWAAGELGFLAKGSE